MNRRELQKICKKFSLDMEDGTKHIHVRNKRGKLIAVFSKGSLRSGKNGHAEQNILAQLRRGARL